MASPPNSDLVLAWLGAVARPEVVLALEAVYLSVTAQIESRGPACWASGRCCNFDRAGHRLYVTGLEVAYLWSRLQGEDAAAAHTPSGVLPAVADVQAARARGDCPFLSRNLCGVHDIKPLGCRIYFCDHSAQEWQRHLYERALAAIRDIHDRQNISYHYGEWRAMLQMFAEK